jgi:hypothetical protein
LLRCLHVEHGEEQHFKAKIRGNSNMIIEATCLMHVKVKIKQGQRSRLGLGLRLDAHKKNLIKNK